MKKTIILIRHVESLKNKGNRLSSDGLNEYLTKKGCAQARLLANNIKFFIENNNLTAKHIYSANSSRAIMTGEYIADKLSLDVVSYDEFKSFSVGNYSGMSERKIKNIDPEFIDKLMLYRKSLLNSYDIIYHGSKETLIEYERKVMNRFKDIVDADDENCKVIVMHRSALTATLINIAREYYSYPRDFYGYIKIDLGSVTIIDYFRDKMTIQLACSNSNQMSKIKAMEGI